MRCPECNVRNSVAAKLCQSCGTRFKRKPLPRKLKIAGFALTALFALWTALFTIVPQLTNPEQNLEHIAKRAAKGPKNIEDAQHIRQEFDRSIRNFLPHIGHLTSARIADKLKRVLPTNTFEAHVVDLPRGLKVVEIDTVLQATSYLLMTNSSRTKVFSLPGLEVFDDARIISESEGPVLVLLGHSSGQPPHHPHIKVYSLLPDDISDETEKLVPAIRGEGSARFTANGRDILLDLSLPSLGQSEKLFSNVSILADGTAHQYLEWKDAHYASRYDYGTSQFAALYAVARCMRYPDLIATHMKFLGQSGRKLVENFKSPNAGNFQVRRTASPDGTILYDMTGITGKFQIEVKKEGQMWSVAEAKSMLPAEQDSLANTSLSANPNHPTAEKKTTSQSTKPTLAIKPQAEQVEINHAGVISPGERAEISRHIPASTVNLRIQPNTKSQALAELGKGSTIEVLSKENGWYKVRHKGKEGFVFGGLVDYYKPEAYTTATIRAVRLITDNKAKTISQAQIGDRVVVLGGIENNKYKVKLANGKIGYVDKDAVDVLIEAPPLMP
ncbi:MAG: SH3 domain-containing protein [Candidatus Melainabacteria bacterium]|nr:SH3 domain-containing protein [Candidatus Melainabacteria bacterium]